MTDLKQEARTLTLGERMILAARLAVEEHLRQSVSSVPHKAGRGGSGDFRGTDSRRKDPLTPDAFASLCFPARDLVGAP